MVNAFVKLTIAGGCVLGGVAFPPLLAGAGIGWGAVLATALGNVAAGNAANVVDALLAGGGKVSLENHDLTKAVGKAIAAVITLAALQHQGETGKSLQKIAAHAEKNWVKIAQQELTQQRYPALREAQLDQFLTPEDYHLTQEGNLKWQDWSDIFIRLNMATRKDGGFPLPSNLYEEVAKLLHKAFPQALRETLKEDFAQDGKAFAGLTLQLLMGMRAELAELRNTNPGAIPPEYPQMVEQFQQLEAQLQGTAAQQQALFNQLSNEITSGFAEVCQQLGVMETHITGLLQNLDDNLVGLRQDMAEVKETLRQGFSQQQGRQISKREFRNRQKVLSEMSIEVEARLNQSLHNAVLLNLGKEQQPHQVERRWDMSVKIGEQKPFQLPSETGILEVFENRSINGNFLILGKPGSGKTTTLLELLRDLVARAENDSDALIPVKLELSEWQTVRKNKFLPFGEKEEYDPSIKEWVLSQIQRMGVGNEIAEHWLRDKELILLLDGLDELPSERQAKCVRAINEFLESGEYSPQHLVVCSRKEEYEDYEEKLRLNTAICLEDLTVEQMQHYFASVNLGEFWESIKDSDKIVDLIRQPLFLAITSIAYQQIDVEEWRGCKSEENSIDYLLGIYRLKVIKIKSKYYHEYTKTSEFENRVIRIAKNFLDTGIEVSIYKLQPTFLPEKDLDTYCQLTWANFFILVFTIGLGSGFFLVDNHRDSLASYILFVIFPVLLFCGFLGVGSLREEIKETLNNIYGVLFYTCYLSILFLQFSFNTGILKGAAFGLVIALSICSNYRKLKHIDFSILTSPFTIDFWGGCMPIMFCAMLLSLGLQEHYFISNFSFFVLMFFMVVFWDDNSEKNNNEYNQNGHTKINPVVSMGIIKILIVLISCLILAFLVAIKEGLNVGISNFMILILIGIHPALLTCIQYFSLRLTLWLTGQMPWNITRFLDYCTERLILQRVGNRYRFIHRLVQEHFANLPIQKE